MSVSGPTVNTFLQWKTDVAPPDALEVTQGRGRLRWYRTPCVTTTGDSPRVRLHDSRRLRVIKLFLGTGRKTHNVSLSPDPP